MPLEPKEVDNSPGHYGLTALYESHGPAIFGYLRMHMRSLEDAEDLLLEVFLAALEHDDIAALSPGEQLAWLRRVAHNKLLNVYRQASRNPQVALDSIMEPILEDEDPEQLALRQEERSRLRASILSIPDGLPRPRRQHTVIEQGQYDGVNDDWPEFFYEIQGKGRTTIERAVQVAYKVIETHQLYSAGDLVGEERVAKTE